MSGVTRPRGPLPQGVYWARRAVVLGMAILLVAGLGSLLTKFGGTNGTTQQGTLAGQTTTKSKASVTKPTASPSPTYGALQKPMMAKTKGNQVASPASGPCDDAALTVTPQVATVFGGRTLKLPLAVTTSGDACNWTASKSSLVVRISSGSDRIWSTQDCPDAISSQPVVVRPTGEQQTTIEVTWSGRRSVAGCLKGTKWASPGYYHVTAATLGGQPTDIQFQVLKPPRGTRTETITPSPKPTKSSKPKQHKPTKKPTKKPSPAPSKKN